jgi:hypothetical protein
VYPKNVPTLFNQLDAAGVSWKGYAQDLGNPDESGPTYVPKHFPFPWFESIRAAGDCNSQHIAICSTTKTVSITTCRAPRRPRPSAGSRRPTAATHTTPSAMATTSRAASPGLDKKGHVGYAAQPGLAPFGKDVFNNPRGREG